MNAKIEELAKAWALENYEDDKDALPQRVDLADGITRVLSGRATG